MLKNKKGFTFTELLTAVLILGILTAIGIPLYTSAVDKTRFNTMLPYYRAIKNAEEHFFVDKGFYSADQEDLYISYSEEDFSCDFQTLQNGDTANVVKITHNKLPNVRLAGFFDNNLKFAGQLYCEAKNDNNRANKLCSKSLGGAELYNTSDGYTGFLLNEEMSAYVCSKSGGSWAESQTKCYEDVFKKCDALGLNAIINTNQCG